MAWRSSERLSLNAALQELDPRHLRFHRDALGHLSMEYQGQRYEEVRPVRSFPFTAPWEFIALQDKEGKEIGLLRRVQDLEPSSREALVQELEDVYFIPRILQIHRITSYLGTTRWEVETDRGPRVFEVRDRDDVRRLSLRRYLIRDVDGNRYEIADVAELDPKSQDWFYQMA